jgi:tRNA1(Val) A37 N6-methylase TrmN6
MSEIVEITEDGFLGGKLRLRQPRSGHRAGHDAMLLAAATSAHTGDRVVDFGAGVGAAGLALASRVDGIDLVLIEIDQNLAEFARGNAALNGLKASICVLDIGSSAHAFASAGLPADSVDVVLMNPPFNDSKRHRASPDAGRQVAHVANATTLDGWVHAARRTLKSGGVLTLIWRADGLAEVLAALARGFGSVAILPVHGDPVKPAIRVLVRAVKNGRAPTSIFAGLMLNDAAGSQNPRVRSVLMGQDVLPLAQF